MAVEALALIEFVENGISTEYIFKPNCKLQNPPKQNKETSNDTVSYNSTVDHFTISARCSSPYVLDIYSWELNESEDPVIPIKFIIAFPRVPHVKKIAPPPQLV